MFNFDNSSKIFVITNVYKVDISINNNFFENFIIAIYIVDYEICQRFENRFQK